MKGKHDDSVQLDGWLATRLLDEALRVFGILLSSAHVQESEFDDELLGQLRLAAFDLLDDVARLSPLVAAAPVWLVPRDEQPPVEQDEAPLACRAVEALANYTQGLATLAIIYGYRGGPSATIFTQLAASAEARIERLGA